MINGHIAYPIRIIDYQIKMKFNIEGTIEELVVAFPIVFIYHYFVRQLNSPNSYQEWRDIQHFEIDLKPLFA